MVHRRQALHKRCVKLPALAKPPLKKTLADSAKTDSPAQQEVSRFCDDLVGSEWLPHCARPLVVGVYAIWRWNDLAKTWRLLYVGNGHVANRLQTHFTGRTQMSSADVYLTSCPKSERGSIWLTYCKDPHYPYKGISLDAVVSTLCANYNRSERPLLQPGTQAPTKSQPLAAFKVEARAPAPF